ncbi:MAG: BlaI/MecI/CopY family transcriptional regulator [Gemmatimonadota bacterium]
MSSSAAPSLSRRERQVLDALYRLQRATVATVVEELPDGASYSAVRAALRTLREKALVVHRADGPRYVYAPRVPAEKARRSALDHLVSTFFAGSPSAAAAALLRMSDGDLPERSVADLLEQIESARGEGR